MKVLIAGASVSAGAGLAYGHNDPEFWGNMLVNRVYNNADITNISNIGDDNTEILLKSSTEIRENTYDVALICWQAIHRLNYNFGFELYNTRNSITTPDDEHKINLVNNVTVSNKEIRQTKKLLFKHHNYVWDIINLIGYVNLIYYIAESRKTNVYFVNYNMPWGNNKVFNMVSPVTYLTLDQFTRDMLLQFDYRSDAEIEALYTHMHTQWQRFGGICEDSWINLYTPLSDHVVDVASATDSHPGYKSQHKFVDILAPMFEKLIHT